MTASWSGAVRRERGGETFEAVSGTASGTRAVDGTTRFQAGSVSKTVLAITVLHLVEQGVLDLHSPIGAPLPTLSADKASLTLHQLLTHTSGLGHWRDLPGVDIADPPTRAELLPIVLDTPAPRPAGSFSYSNFGYLLAAIVVEAVTGGEYRDAAGAAVLEPAGMRSTTSGVFPIAEPDCASGFRDGVQLVTSPTPTSIPGVGDLWTTTADLIRMSEALHSGRLLHPGTVATMTSPLVAFPETTVADDRLLARGYGYGTWVGTLERAPATIHVGDNVGYRSLLVHVADRHEHIAILTNDDGSTLRAPLDLALAAR